MEALIKKQVMQSQTEESQHCRNLIAKTFYSGFADADDTFNSISLASDGKVYYILSSSKHNVGGRMFSYDPSTGDITFLADLTSICGEGSKNYIAQGKSHVRFYECDRKLYFATHVGYYQLIDGRYRLPVNPPDGYNLYSGGHIVCYNIDKSCFEDLAILPHGEGAIAMTMDRDRKQIFIITWPTGRFIHYDVAAGNMQDLGYISGAGEAGVPGKDFRVLCRSLFVNSFTGTAYFSIAEGDILSYTPGDDTITKLTKADLRLDYFGKYDVTMPGNMGYNWRKIFWHAQHRMAYGVHGNSGYLFRFDPHTEELCLIKRITSIPSKKSGMYDQFSYGYLGFALGPDQETVYYLTGGPIYNHRKMIKETCTASMGTAKNIENLHLVTYHLKTGVYKDYGPIFYENGERPLNVNSIAIGTDGTIYTLARVNINGKIITDLISIKNPLVS